MAALTALTWWYGASIAHLPDFSGDGVAVTLIILISTPVQTILLWLMAGQVARRTGSDAARYLGFVWPSRSHIALGVAAVIAFIVLGDAVTWAFGRNVVTGFQNDIYRTAAKAGWLPWLWLVVVVVTPFGEETLFRGFLFRGWHRTPGDAWAVDPHHRGTVCNRACTIRPLRHRAGLRVRRDARLVPLGERLDHPYYAAARAH